MKKSNFLLVGVAALLLASCGKNGVTYPAVDRDFLPAVTSLSLDKAFLLVEVEKTETLKVTFNPAESQINKLIFTSSDEDVATVTPDENDPSLAIVEGVGAGNCEITITVENSNYIGKTIKVEVVNPVRKNAMEATINPLMTEMSTLQKTKFGNDPKVDKADMFWIENQTIKKNGVQRSYTTTHDTYLADISGAYFSVGGTETFAKVEGGNSEIANFMWAAYTSEQFKTTLYHISGNNRTYLDVNTQAEYMTKPRFQAVTDAFNSLFRNGKNMVARPTDWALSVADLTTDYERYSSLITGGFYNEGGVGYTLEQNNYKFTIAPEDEATYDIPAYTEVFQDYTQKIIWRGGQVVGMHVVFQLRYTIGDDSYVEDTTRDISFKVNDDVQYERPNKEIYKQVDSIFDL